MARRRKYDTEALVGQLKAERRTGMLLSIAGVGILGLLIVLYVAGVGADEEQEDTAVTQVETPKPAEPPKPDKPPEKEPEKEPEPPPPSGPAKVSLTLSKKGVVWLGKKKLGKFKKKKLEIPIGTHVLKIKVGRKTVKHTLEIKGGESLALSVDHKRRKVTVKGGP